MIPASYGYLKVPVFADDRGKLWKPSLPFEVKNEFYVTNLDGKPRGGHAHRTATQAIWCIQGTMMAVVEAKTRDILHGISAGYIILVPPKTWVTLTQFSKDCCYAVWASEPYDEADIIRDQNEFFQWYGRHPSPVAMFGNELVVGDALGAL